MQHLFDTTYEVETPEAIDLSAKIAGPAPRALAYTIDLSIRLLALLLILAVLAFLGEVGWGVFFILSFAMEWFYPVLFEVLRQGQTPGKKMLGIAVVNDDLTPVTWSTSITRNLLRAIDILPFAYALGIITMACTQHFQRLGDLAAGSVVIYRKKYTTVTNLPPVKPSPPPIPLSIEDQLAITSFTQRHQEISSARQQELAAILQPLINQNKKDQHNNPVIHLHAVGNWLLGKRE